MAEVDSGTKIARTWHDQHRSKLTRGERAADIMRNGMGSWGFVFGFLGFLAAWALVNWFTPVKWDGYPFIALNLILSLIAGLQGAILLIAAKRQDAIAAAMAKHDYDTNVAAKREIDLLIKINNEQLELIKELRNAR